jgi:hypothetical protein
MKFFTVLFFLTLITNDANAIGQKFNCNVKNVSNTDYRMAVGINSNKQISVNLLKKNKSMGTCNFKLKKSHSRSKAVLLFNIENPQCNSGYNIFKKNMEVVENGFLKIHKSKNIKQSKAFLHVFKKHQTQPCHIERMNLNALNKIKVPKK